MGNEASSPVLQKFDPNDSEANKLKSIRTMDSSIRNRLRQGVQYNMKMIIRGGEKTGKSTLWKRLQGGPFAEEYNPTPEIQAATIDWSFKNYEDAVKVEIWDVVDEGFVKSPPSAAEVKADHNSSWNGASLSILDASLVDVYQNTHAVIFMISPFSQSSLDYTRSESSKVPAGIAILLLLNFRDCISIAQYDQYYGEASATPIVRELGRGHEIIQVTPADVQRLAEEVRLARGESVVGSGDPVTTSSVFVIESSLKNCWGLVELNKFFDVPFLMLKKKSLEERLRTTRTDLAVSTHGLLNNNTAANPASAAIDKYQRYYKKYMEKWQEGDKPIQTTPSLSDSSSSAGIATVPGNSRSSTLPSSSSLSSSAKELEGKQIVRNAKNKQISRPPRDAPAITDIEREQAHSRKKNDDDEEEEEEREDHRGDSASPHDKSPASNLILKHSSARSACNNNEGVSTATMMSEEKTRKKKTAAGKDEEFDILEQFIPSNTTQPVDDDNMIRALDDFLDDGAGVTHGVVTNVFNGIDESSLNSSKNEALSDDYTHDDNRVRLTRKKKKNIQA